MQKSDKENGLSRFSVPTIVTTQLRGEGQYVVGEGSCIAGKVWEVEANRPIRSISQTE